MCGLLHIFEDMHYVSFFLMLLIRMNNDEMKHRELPPRAYL